MSERTLLIAGSAPGDRTVGELLLRDMLSCVEASAYLSLAISGTLEGEPRPTPIPVRVLRCPIERGHRPLTGRWASLAVAWRRLREYEPAVRRLAGEIEAVVRDERITRVWAVLDSTAVIDATAIALGRVRKPLLAHVWDDVDHLCTERGLDGYTRRRTRRRVAQLLHTADRTAVICEQMASDYARRFGARCQIVRHGIVGESEPDPTYTSFNEFRIGFAGGMYCPSAWQSLIKALDRMSWRAGPKQVRLVTLGGSLEVRTSARACVEYLGWRSTEESVRALRGCDLLYLPQPFEDMRRPLATLSFPTKFSTYVGVGRPVLVHAPPYATLPAFCREHGLGSVVTSLDPKEIVAEIRRLAERPAAFAEAARAAARIANLVLNRQSFMRQTRDFLEPWAVRGEPVPQGSAPHSIVAERAE